MGVRILTKSYYHTAPRQNNDVLCPVCKRDYLLQAGVPSSSIVCACGFRLDTGGDRLGLEHLKQQLAETYVQHRRAQSSLRRTLFFLPMYWVSCRFLCFIRHDVVGSQEIYYSVHVPRASPCSTVGGDVFSAPESSCASRSNFLHNMVRLWCVSEASNVVVRGRPLGRFFQG